MTDPGARNRTFVSIAIGISVLALGAWLAWIVPQPPCGPPGNTELARTDRWVPWALIASEVAALAVAGLILKRALLTIIATVVSIGGVAVVCGGFITFAIAAHANCFA